MFHSHVIGGSAPVYFLIPLAPWRPLSVYYCSAPLINVQERGEYFGKISCLLYVAHGNIPRKTGGRSRSSHFVWTAAEFRPNSAWRCTTKKQSSTGIVQDRLTLYVHQKQIGRLQFPGGGELPVLSYPYAGSHSSRSCTWKTQPET